MIRYIVCLFSLLVFTSTLFAQNVSFTESEMTLDWYSSTPRYIKEPHKNNAFRPVKGSHKKDGQKTFKQLILENEYLRVHVAPEIGGAVNKVIYKPTNEDLFYDEKKAKDWIPFWESGVKPSFPFREHGMATIQPASWRVIKHEDGSKTIALWMEFSHHNARIHRNELGRYSNMFLSQWITLKPGENFFSVTYRITNPGAWRQGARVWNDALFPKNHTKDGIIQGDEKPPVPTDTEIILPASVVSEHWGKEIRIQKPEDFLLKNYKRPHQAVFPWQIKYGFVGLYYPQVKVNRLRLNDPVESPAAKLYVQGDGSWWDAKGNVAAMTHMKNFVEYWGGPDSVFEGIEHWLHHGQTMQFTHEFAFIKGIGKVEYASKDIAVAVDGKQLGLVGLRTHENVSVSWNGKALKQGLTLSPTSPVLLELPDATEKGKLVIASDGNKILDQAFPLPMPVDTSGHEIIRYALKGTWAADENRVKSWYAIDGSISEEDKKQMAIRPPKGERAEMVGNALVYGKNFFNAIGAYPHGSVDKGRVMLRAGYLKDPEQKPQDEKKKKKKKKNNKGPKLGAIGTLKLATQNNAQSGEAWHLLGAVQLELGDLAAAEQSFKKALQVKTPYHASAYFLALIQLQNKARKDALATLKALTEKAPDNWEGRLLYAALLGEAGKPMLKQMEMEDPADLRVQWVLAQMGDKGARAGYDALAKGTGAAQRMREFQASLNGEYVVAPRLK